jgi:hypothetical protein
MTLAKVSPLWKSTAEPSRNTPSGYKKVPVPVSRNGDCALLLLDLNQQPFD